MGQCFDATQCLHAGTCCEASDSEICVCDPVDASNYPNDAIIFFVARFSNFSRPNIHVIFEDSWEDTYNIDSDYTWAYSSYELNGWNGRITAELRDGSVVKETITTISGSGAIGRVHGIHVVGDVLVGNTVKVYCDMTNVGTPAANNFKLQLINSDTGEEFSAITPNPISCNPGGTNTVVFSVPLPSTTQTVNLRFNVILLANGTETLHDYETMNLAVVAPETCEHGEKKYDYCADGSRVDTDICIVGNWYDTESDCEECTVSGGRTKICAEPTGDLPAGTEIVTHRCVDGKWLEVARCGEDAECFGEGDEKKVICDDGTEIVTHTCVNWKWVETGNHCPGEGGGSPCVSGEVHTMPCDDGSEIVTHRCVNGKWVETGNTCPDAGGCTSDVTEVCDDGSTITTKRCVDGTLVDTGATCPEKGDTGIIVVIIAAIIGLYLYLRGG